MKLRAVLLAIAAILLLSSFFLMVRVPADAVGVIESGRPGERPPVLRPGIHFHPIGSKVVTYSTEPATASGEVLVTPVTGGEIPTRFTVSARLDPERASELHAAMGGRPMLDFLSAQVAILLREYAARAEAVEVLTPQFRARAEEEIAGLMKRGGLADTALTIKPPDEDTLLAASQYLASRREAWKIRQTVAEALGEPEGSGSWKLHTAMGLVNESEKLLVEAEKNYLDALAIEPGTLPPMSQLVTLYSAVEEWVKLSRILDASLTANPRSLQHINWTAVVLMKLEDQVGAERILKSGLEVDPSNSTLLANLGTLYMKQNRVEEAIARFRKAVESAPASQQALFNLGSAMAATGRFADALPHLERAEEAGPASLPLVRTLAIVHEKLGNKEKAASYRVRTRTMEAEQAAARKRSSPKGGSHGSAASSKSPS